MHLALTRLDLSHFRSHRRTVLEFDGRPVAIHGPNGAGKTNLIEAVSLLSPGRGLRRAVAADLARRQEALGWRIGAVLDGDGPPREIDLRAESGQPRALRIDGKAATQTALGRLIRILWLVPAMDRLWTEAADGRRRFLDRIALSFAPDHAEASLSYDRALRERNRLLRDDIHDSRWLDALEARMGVSGAAITHNRRTALDRIAAAQDGAATAFPAAGLSLVQADDAHAEDADALRAALARGRAADFRAGRSLIGPHRADLDAVYAAKGIAAAQCSTGEQKALLISLVLANARALAEDLGAPPILLLDEVAAHLDTDRRAALFDEIVALGAQALLTGTGPELFDDFGARAQYLSVTETGGESEVTPTVLPPT
ncbi:MAG: DNA replication/repair protein RecF [Rhodobacteraceae bacterium]|nr:DNA replication/repair protein RecF [Paracoccaceae bacterium]